MSRSFRITLLAVAGWAALGSLALAESSHLVRFYYAPWATGYASETPADTEGDNAQSAVDYTWKGDIELILFRRVGLGASRQWVGRTFSNPAHRNVHEEWVQYFYNLTLYVREAGYDRFNLFLGGSGGEVEKYRYSVDRTRMDDARRHEHIPLSRVFGGIDYTFQRIGYRLEYSKVEAEHETAGVTDSLKQTFLHFAFFIPFN